MSTRNQVQLIGHLGKDVEMLTSENTNKVAKTTMATKETYKNKKGEKVENTDWHQLVLFGSVAELAAKYLKKGSHIMVQGQLKTRSYVGKDEIQRWTTEIIVQDILFLDVKK